ncbi:MAG: pseudouridine synthase [Bacteroidota bacterium]|nr:pseudouridine synthase [Bacteroidota bacterium]
MDTINNPEIIFQDEHIIVVNKPVNLPVHKNDFMPHDAPYLTKAIGNMTNKSVYNVHRLDSKTSGLIVLTFSKEAAHNLALQFEQRRVQKTYYAVVRENPGEGIFDRKVTVKKKTKFKKPAKTNYKTVKTVATDITYKTSENINISIVKIEPETGRWHQLRQHFAQERFDIIGDTQHGDFTLNRIITEKTGIKRLLLHASKLRFFHPETDEAISFEIDIPSAFNDVLSAYEKSL